MLAPCKQQSTITDRCCRALFCLVITHRPLRKASFGWFSLTNASMLGATDTSLCTTTQSAVALSHGPCPRELPHAISTAE